MYDVTFVYNDFKQYKVEIETEELNEFLLHVRHGSTYFDKTRSVGFWLPLTNLRCFYLNKRELTQAGEEPCQKVQNLDQGLDLKS